MRCTDALIIDRPNAIALRATGLKALEAGELLVEVEASGISTGTERLLFSGDMPPFPGLGYPLVPGYEAVGRVVSNPGDTGPREGERVFVPGSSGFSEARGLFGAQARHLVTRADRTVPVPAELGADAILLALAATAHHAVKAAHVLPELIVGHGVLGRLMGRIVVALGGLPTVWETNAVRRSGTAGYSCLSPDEDERRDYVSILDASGDPSVLDSLIARSARAGEIVLAGFYKQPVAFAFPPAFMRETRLRVAAEWAPGDMSAVTAMVANGSLSLANLVTHSARPTEAVNAYRTAFEDADCLKMIIEWERSA